MYKLPTGMPTANRVKLHNLALGITLLSQGFRLFMQVQNGCAQSLWKETAMIGRLV